MYSIIISMLGRVKTWQLLALAFAAGIASGGWLTIKYYTAAEAQELRQQMQAQAESYTAAMLAERSLAEKRLEIANARTTVKEVVRYVPTDAACNIPGPTARLLESHRQGVFAPARQTTRDPPDAPQPLGLPASIDAHFDLAALYHQCRQQIIEIRAYYHALE